MLRFLARFLALLVSGVFLIAALAVLVQIRPTGTAGWLVLAGLVTGAILGPAWLYRRLTRGVRDAEKRNATEGAGVAMGVGVETARRQQSDRDDDFDFDPD